MKTLRFTLGLLLGCATAVLAARTLWPAYAAAEPHKHYTPTMLLARLAVGALSAAAAACATTAAARDNSQAAWTLGAVFLALSLPNHLYPGYVWHDYPVWYHLLYLAYLVPITGLTGRLFCKLAPHV